METQIKIAIDKAKKQAGSGWSMLGPQIQEALIMREAAMLILAQGHEKYEPAQDFLQAVFSECPDYD